jgi:hypothetical protein
MTQETVTRLSGQWPVARQRMTVTSAYDNWIIWDGALEDVRSEDRHTFPSVLRAVSPANRENTV